MLYFPKLIYLDQRTVNNGGPLLGDHSKEINVYQLDWSGFNHLPTMYNNEVNSLLFGIDANYLAEIERNQNRAIEEWNYARDFDTCIRDMCLGPAIAHVQVVFKLIWDCTYYLQEDHSKWWLSNAMIYRMWMGQTGGGCVSRNAKIDELRETADRLYLQEYEAGQHGDILGRLHSDFTNFLIAIRKHPRVFPKEYKMLRFKESYVSPFTGEKH